MNTVFLILLVLLVGGCVIAFRILKHRQVHLRRVNPPERIWTEVRLPFGEAESIDKFARLAVKLRTKTSSDKKIRQSGAGSIGTVFAAWHEPGSNQPELHFYIVCDAQDQQAVKASIKTYYADAFLLPVSDDDLRSRLIQIWQEQHPFRSWSEILAEVREGLPSRKTASPSASPGAVH